MKDAIKHIVILGHSGFLGSRLYHMLREKNPELTVVGLSASEMDLTNAKDVQQLTPQFRPDSAVVMCAAIKRQEGDTRASFIRNMQMVANVCDLLAGQPVARFVYLSSAAVYGEDVENLAIDEDTESVARSYYGLSKYASEWILRKTVAEAGNGPLCIVRPATIYGPCEASLSYGPSRFLHAAVNEEPIVLWGDGTELRELIFVDDVIAALYRLTFLSFDGVVNLVAGQSYSFRDVLSAVAETVGTELNVSSRERSKAKVDHRFWNDRLMDLLPNLKITPLREGIHLTYERQYRNSQPSGKCVGRVNE